MSDPLKQKIQDDVKQAMRDKNKERLATLRLLTAAIKQIEVDKRIELGGEDLIAVIDKMIKQRRESIKQYEQGGRQDLADQEVFEINILQEYMPEALSADEINAMIDAAIGETGASTIKDMGKVMNTLRPKMQGRADLGQVSATIKSRLSN